MSNMYVIISISFILALITNYIEENEIRKF